jgi:hypothetical protein
VLGPPELLARPRLLLFELLLDEHHDKAPSVLIGDLLKGFDQAEHLQIFNGLGHGKNLIGKTER